MVAITVILAAVIGAFVLGLGDEMGQTAPNAQVSVDGSLSDDGASPPAFAIGTDDVTIEHTRGDSIEVDELRLVVRQDGTSVGTIDGSELDQSGDEINVGDTITLDANASGALGAILDGKDSSSTEIVIEVVHTPSGSQLASGVVHDTA